MVNTMAGKIQFDTTSALMNVSKSYQKNVESQEKDIIGQLMLVLNTCLKMKGVCVDDQEDLEESNK